MASYDDYPHEPIAIIGTACRFPGGASSPSKLWDTLTQPPDLLRRIPRNRFNAEKFYHPDNVHHGTSNVQHSYVLEEDVREFDAEFFGIKPTEAKAMSPEQRILLETTYEALESAGVTIETLRGSMTGVFVGLMCEDYSSIAGKDFQNIPTYLASGTARSIMSNRLSHFFDLHGPSMTIDTACSSSLVALHQAVQSLRNDESSCAIVAGANLLLSPDSYIAESKLKMLSPSGRSKMWDRFADGYGRADGIGVIVLKTLSCALADRDTVECIVRETAVNQDGYTKGITMPSAAAQAQLIHLTYQKAGLNPTDPSNRPHYFEAHGTGTPAGDPIEAEAISAVFFGSQHSSSGVDNESPLYVGSIKTCMGHSEGAAGIAGVIKTSLALQNSVIPPNFPFDELNSKVLPFYAHLKIPLEPEKWPHLPSGAPRRGSVNSFGFGGTNAHAILESFDPCLTSLATAEEEIDGNPSSRLLTPFNFSATSVESLLSSLGAYSSKLTEKVSISLRDLSWTLNSRRSTLPYRVSIPAPDRASLIKRLNDISKYPDSIETASVSVDSKASSRVLGIFTGQGAQWPRMGSELIKSSQIVVDCIEALQYSLDTLPSNHAPDWSIKAELLKDVQYSRVGQVPFSQPLCTAVQIALVELLRAARVNLTAVVGHSSGEIAAAYAAGYLSAKDAIRIAYYRGLFLNSNKIQLKTPGTMIAVETTLTDAQELCDLPLFRGRVCVAAINSPTSITLSGDSDAISEVGIIMADEHKFSRLLKVDQAYHSHHMVSVVDDYLQALQKCDIQPETSHRSFSGIRWVSSVIGDIIDNIDITSLKAVYWSDNMVEPVRFSEAIGSAFGTFGPFDLAVEIGPHPNLRKPAVQTINEIYGQAIPYIGTLNRGTNDVEAFANTLGSLWKILGVGAVDFNHFDRVVHGTSSPPAKLIKMLPTYAWKHDRSYWHDTRYTRAFLGNGAKTHPFLGAISPDETENEFRFKNYLSQKELPWLSDHCIQGQVVFPAAGYISTVLEAVSHIYKRDKIEILELFDITMRSALFIPEDGGVETMLSLKVLEDTPRYLKGIFAFYSDARRTSNIMIENATGEFKIAWGHPSDDSLPLPFIPLTKSFRDVDDMAFYQFLRDLGYEYEGLFKRLSSLGRRLGESIGVITVPTGHAESNAFILHPSTMDCAFQATLLAYSYPGDGELDDLHLPTKIDRLSINLSACRSGADRGGTELSVFSSAWTQDAGLLGDAEVYSAESGSTIFQLQGLHARPMSKSQAKNKKNLFFEMTWGPENPAGVKFDWEQGRFDNDRNLAFLLERVALFYFRRARLLVRNHDLSLYARSFMDYIDRSLAQIEVKEHPWASETWLMDSKEDVLNIIRGFPLSVDLKIMQIVGENLVAIISGETDLSEAMRMDGLLDEFHAHALGMDTYLVDLARMFGELTHRFPHMNILEIGAGTGAATDVLLRNIDTAGTSFSSYTYTDISSEVLEKARLKFVSFGTRIAFKTLDIEKPAVSQGFAAGSYDLIVASLVLHATRDLEETLIHMRGLLRPGGYLLLHDVTDCNSLRLGLLFGGLPVWWHGRHNVKRFSPCISTEELCCVMRDAGFAGIDAITPHCRTFPIPFSVLCCQATETRIEFLRNPLALDAHASLGRDYLTILGHNELNQSLVEIIGRHYREIRYVESLNELATLQLPFLGSVISFLDIGKRSIFESMTQTGLEAIQNMFRQSKVILWVTTGAQAETPFANMFIGLLRTVVLEMTHLRTKVLNFPPSYDIDYNNVAKLLLQLEAYTFLQEKGDAHDILWCNESEVVISARPLIPRLRLSTLRNHRHSSARAPLRMGAITKGSYISIRQYESQYMLEETIASCKPTTKQIGLTHSLVKAVLTSDQYSIYLSLGRVMGENQEVVVATKSLDSVTCSPPSLIFPAPPTETRGPRLLILLYTDILANRILSKAFRGRWLVILDPDPILGEVLAKLCDDIGVDVVLLTTTRKRCIKPWKFLHSRATKRHIADTIPTNPSTFIYIGEDTELSEQIRDFLPRSCQKMSLGDIINTQSEFETYPTTTHGFSKELEYSSTRCLELDGLFSDILNSELPKIPQLNLQDLASYSSISPGSQAVVAWEANGLIPIQFQPSSNQVHFSPDKTYWLVGLANNLGQSLCQWMASRGAKYIALSSRHPSVGIEWLQMMEGQARRVNVFPCDVTDKESLLEAHRNISKYMPPIAGVVQGAMVLHDTMFPDLDFQRFQKMTAPKVQGSILLDDIFCEDTLDFMIFLSSIAYIAGNAGQSAYTAANAFMASLAANRRKRGLAASVAHIGAILGNGYISREMTRERQLYLEKAGFSFMSEQAFHESFAEGVLASRADSEQVAEIITGLRLQCDGVNPTWAPNPIFQHLVSYTSTTTESHVSGVRKSQAAIKFALKEAVDDEHMFEIIRDGFLAKLKVSLQRTTDESLVSHTPDGLGIDSLVAVDLQSWFRTELSIDISVLEILHARDIHALVTSAQKLVTLDKTTNTETNNLVPSIGLSSERIGFRKDASSKGASSSSPKAAQITSNEPTTGQGLQSDPRETSPGMSRALQSYKNTPTHLTEAHNPKTLVIRVPMSYAQSRFWFLNSFVEDPTAFNVTTSISLEGGVDFKRLSNALKMVGQRHEAIRTMFYVDPIMKTPMQGILQEFPSRLEHIITTTDRQISQEVEEINGHCFNLSRGETLRLKILSMSEKSHCLVLGYHHIAMDGISFDIFCSDLEQAYHGTTFATETREILQYSDSTLREAQQYENGSWSEHLDYWHKRFQQLPAPLPLLSLARGALRPTKSTFDSFMVQFRLEQSVKSQIDACCQHFNVKPFHFYLTTFGVLLFRYTDHTSDICIGVAEGNRKDADILHSLGLYLNLVPLRFHQKSDQTFSSSLKNVKAEWDDAFAHSRVPFAVLLDELNAERSSSYSPLFQSLFNYRKNIREVRTFLGCKAEGESISVGKNAYDISLDILESASRENLVSLSVNRTLYTESDAEMLKTSYVCLLASFAKNPAVQVTQPSVYPRETESTANLAKASGPKISSRWPATIVDRIDYNVKAHGSRLALKNWKQQTLTYIQMAQRVGQISYDLANRGVGRGCNVGLFQTPDLDCVCTLLAILRIGAAVIPMDPDAGIHRLVLAERDGRPTVIVVDSSTESEVGLLENSGASVMKISELPGSPDQEICDSYAREDDVAVIIYTSGSTSTPKGVCLPHAAIRNFIEFVPPTWGIEDTHEVFLQQSSLAFDMSLCQIFTCLAYGGTLIIPGITNRHDPAAISSMIVAENVSVTLATPTEYLAWFRQGNNDQLRLSSWHSAVSGGETITGALIREFQSLDKDDLQLTNCYGPTETTFACAQNIVHYRGTIDPDLSLIPLPNQAIFILDANMIPVPRGVLGQVAIGGAGVANGYTNAVATSTHFISNGFIFKNRDMGRIHLSGDRGRINANGCLALNGRIGNTQIKIGGVRVDLEDMENSIVVSMSPYIRQIVVSPRNNRKSTSIDFLVAFVVLSEEHLAGMEVALPELAQKLPLPRYMRPSLFIRLEYMPKTTSGKIDRSAINSMAISRPKTIVDMNDTTEVGNLEEMRHLWVTLLPKDIINNNLMNSDSNFFQLGGNSLSLMNLQALIKEKHHVTIPIHRFFDASTLGQMAKLLEDPRHPEGKVEAIDLAEETATRHSIKTLPGYNPSLLPAKVPRVVVLTGATGFLGKHLLKRLIDNDEIEKIHCIAVRKSATSLEDIFRHAKTNIYFGDLGGKQLGLSDQDAETIFAEADRVIHAGADVSFMKSYESLKLTNVKSTKELVRLCLPRRVPFHFVSSATLARLAGREDVGPISFQTMPPTVTEEDGYVVAKWVSEVYLERVSREIGLHVTIHRPSSITGKDVPDSDLMGSVIKFARITGTTPDAKEWLGYFDFVSVETVSRTIIEEVVAEYSEEQGSIRFIYESGEVVVEVSQLKELVTGTNKDKTIEVVSGREWLKLVVEAGMDPLIATYVQRVLKRGVFMPRLMKEMKLR